MGFYSERIFPLLLRRAVRRFVPDRDDLLKAARGRVLEIGVGGGQNLTRYPSGVNHVACLETSRPLLTEARGNTPNGTRGGENGAGFSFYLGQAERLPFRDTAFDTVVSFLIFCSLSDPGAAANEAFRVLKPGGRFLFFEHVRAYRSGLRFAQDALNPLWNLVSCGCNLNRDTRAVFEGAGFEFQEIDDDVYPEPGGLPGPMIKGVAVRPG